jgi:hypothetical protein
MQELQVQLQLDLPADPCPRPCERREMTVVATTFATTWECSGPSQPIEGKGVYLIFVSCLGSRLNRYWSSPPGFGFRRDPRPRFLFYHRHERV